MSLRRIVKYFVFGLCLIATLPLTALSWLERISSQSETVFTTIGELLALFPGLPGSYVRAAYYFGALEECSWEVHVGFGSVFTHRGARLARHVSLGAYCVIGHATIERGARLASRVSVPSGKRQHLDDGGVLSAHNRFERVRIGEAAWIGEGAIVLADVGARCIVSAGAVVVQDAPADSVVGGNPARVLKHPVAKTDRTPPASA
jgi:acetyltransferase-like isoleucine patch superfamily enzyme